MFDLRPYQTEAIEGLRAKIREGKKRLVLVAPTGAGKTVIASSMIGSAVERGNPVLFLAHRKELIDQASHKLNMLGVRHGIIMAGHAPKDYPVQVASIATLARRQFPPATLVIVDEAHHATAGSYKKILEAYPNAVVIGLTATPFRADGTGLGSMFFDSVRVATVQELVDMGFLCHARYWAPPAADMKGVKKSKGDFDTEETAARVDKPTLIGNIVAHYQQLASGARAIAFAVNVAHSMHLRDAFLEAGIPAAHLDGELPKLEREKILADLASGAVRVVTNCGILSEGFDCPAVQVCIQARPTMSIGLHLQQIGRVLRPFPVKDEALILDHAGNCVRHGFATDEHEVDLSKGIAKRKDGPQISVKTCPKCYAVFSSSQVVCPACEAAIPKQEREIKTKEGSLRELRPTICHYCNSDKTEKRPHPLHGTGIWCLGCGRHLRWLGKSGTPSEYYRKQLSLCSEKGWKPGRAWVMFKNRYGRPPTHEEMRAAKNQPEEASA